MAEYSWLIDDIETLSTYTKDGYTKAVLNQSVQAIRKLSADVAPVRHGRWRIGSYSGNIGYAKEKWYDSFFTGAFYYCDCCRERAKRITPYCPNCGCRMDLEADDGK